MPTATLTSPIGPLCVISEGGAITALQWGEGVAQDATPELTEALAQLAAYFEGRLTRFDLPLNVAGSEFQRRVCDAMCDIPFGETVTYGDLAARLGASAQAIGTACGGNPVPLIIPCHRVLAASGLGGYSGQGGVETKVWLLRHEGAAGLLI
ncbi:methylated-DNA--[protein]-cysteine S-methyltransferase [Roseovarius sp.]|uniref:methylated-DNA--[protein]-cysteine S-methyltransferase n=1 Tax=Roseovarius sp. TaxID=1486281 RepID=UPI0025D8EF66|nr:methylated-DNA--[protein]-cysteine S-methyltransferase [Roseovarius sp.]